MVDAAFVSVLVAVPAGLAVSVMIERFMISSPSLVRPWSAWVLHVGLWLTAYALLTFLLGRPWFAVSAVSAFLLMLVLVNNAKVKVLREPFVFQDYEYFTDVIRHPRLYIPFMGWWKFLGAAAGFVLAICVGLWGEPVPAHRFSWLGQSGAIAVVVMVGMLLLLLGNRRYVAVSFDPEHDLHKLGLLASLWRYGIEYQHLPAISSPFDVPIRKSCTSGLPHLVAVQSESFFDPRPIYSGIQTNVLQEFDRLKFDAAAHGKLSVPAWGANTVRTEFAFLSGIDATRLGVHRFNPYRAIAAGWEISSLASFLQGLGYRTVCVHPYPASFYQRDRVYPRLGFEEFIDIRSFDTANRFGPYISDPALAVKVAAIVHEATRPVFIFVITMENHGPLHLERVAPPDNNQLYSKVPPAGCEDLTKYLRHLRNADRMIAALRNTLEDNKQPASLCWFGDHVPIMPTVYSTFGEPSGDVEYCVWTNRKMGSRVVRDLSVQNLAMDWLRYTDIL
jgi:hypothetical protein